MLSPLTYVTCVQRSALAKCALNFHQDDFESRTMIVSEAEFCSPLWPAMTGRRPAGLSSPMGTVWACALLYGPVAVFPRDDDRAFWYRDMHFVLEPHINPISLEKTAAVRTVEGFTVIEALQHICDPVLEQNYRT